MKKPKPKPINIRPKSQVIRDKYLAMGGAKWFNLFFEVEVMKDECAIRSAQQSSASRPRNGG